MVWVAYGPDLDALKTLVVDPSQHQLVLGWLASACPVLDPYQDLEPRQLDQECAIASMDAERQKMRREVITRLGMTVEEVSEWELAKIESALGKDSDYVLLSALEEVVRMSLCPNGSIAMYGE